MLFVLLSTIDVAETLLLGCQRVQDTESTSHTGQCGNDSGGNGGGGGGGAAAAAIPSAGTIFPMAS